MIRVMIADDEIRICKLIMKLIDWEKLGMVIVGTAHNGIEALELIEKENPDIVITDIRMPGYDGLHMIEKARQINPTLEFIIISGYGEFEYAKKAIEFGVREYLLKPINQKDLLEALQKVGEDIRKRNQQISLEKEYEFILKHDVGKVRESFLNNLLLFNKEGFKEYTLREVNESYHFRFQEGLFRVAALKLDAIGKDASNYIKATLDQIADMLSSKLQGIVYEVDSIKNKNNLYIVMNYSAKEKKQMKANLLEVLACFHQRGPAAEKMEVTIALGEEVEDLRDITRSFKAARLLMEDRILKGTGRILETEGKGAHKAEVEELFHHFSKKLMKAVELLDMDEVKRLMLNFKKEISTKNIRGAEVKGLLHEIGNMYYITMKSNDIKMDAAREHRRLKNVIDHCSSMDKLFHEVAEHITSSLMHLSEDKLRNNLRQMRQAKKYIEENYMKNITLEDVGAHIGFNPSYFSSIFKKETGTSFVEYLSKVRMEKAKELLKESDLRIQDICLMVGYSDAKYFTKSFMKHTGLKPNEYRRIFA